MIIEIPIIIMMCMVTISPRGVDGLMPVYINSAAATITSPKITSHLGPNLSNRRPITGDRNPFIRLPGKSTKPAVKALTAIPCCRYMGRISMDDSIIIMQMKIRIRPTVNMGYLKARRSIIGSFILSCFMLNKSKDNAPTANVAITTGLDQPPAPSPWPPALLKPYTMPPKPSVDKMMDKTSILGLVSLEMLGRNSNPLTKEMMKNGSEIQKIQCQLKFARISPAMLGPLAGANIITRPISPMAAPRFSTGKMTNIVLNINGNNNAVPTACRTRATSRISKVGAKAATIVPAIEKIKEVVNSCRVVNHCSSNPDTGTRIPSTSK
ncbi:hypothetical protein D3C75_621330 [compost metagenome]